VTDHQQFVKRKKKKKKMEFSKVSIIHSFFFLAQKGFLDPNDPHNVSKTINVQDQGRPLKQLNELEYINGKIWANIWFQDVIAVIDPSTGIVESYINCYGLRQSNWYTAGVFNGIAYDAQNNRIFVTGKLWPLLFEIQIVEN
jgi:glutaminyl-peptide cyclotransferase